MKPIRCSGPFPARLFMIGLPLGLIAGGTAAEVFYVVKGDCTNRRIISTASPAAVTAPL